MDPVELRKKNMIRLGDIDELSAQLGEGKKGLPRHIRSCGLPECLDRGSAAIDWVRKRRSTVAGSVEPAERVRHLRRGVGVACSMQGSGIAGVDWAAALLKLNEDGSFNLQVGAADLGTGADTVLAQIAAETLGVTLDKMIVCSGDTDFTPFRRRRLRFQHHDHFRGRGEEGIGKGARPRAAPRLQNAGYSGR